MSNSRMREASSLTREAARQGFRVKPTRKGWNVYGPPGHGIVGVHRTPSDHRSFKNTVAELRRIGVAI